MFIFIITVQIKERGAKSKGIKVHKFLYYSTILEYTPPELISAP